MNPLQDTPLFTVTEISNALKRVVEGTFNRVRVRGEISGFKRATSGHLYFSIKDADSVLDGVCWRGQAYGLGVQPEDGLEVICTGKLTTYGGRSKYQMIVDHMEVAGQGALLALLEERKKKLAAEGLFSLERKKKIPLLPTCIGVISSETGAVIQDILHRLSDRFPIHVILWPVLVQGEGAADQIAKAIHGFNEGLVTPMPDVLIVARGGGSVEDLWAFNEESVVRAAAVSRIPLISAVGHETDTTLIDYASDRRAPTPTAAAEMAVPVRLELLAGTDDLSTRLHVAMTRLLDRHRQHLARLFQALPNPKHYVMELFQRLDDRGERLENAVKSYLNRLKIHLDLVGSKIPHPRETLRKAAEDLAQRFHSLNTHMRIMCERLQERVKAMGNLLESYSFERTLDRGFTLIRDQKGKPVTSAKALSTGDDVNLTFRDGQKDAVIR